MRLLSISQCEPGMKLGKSIYNDEGLVLLGADVELTTTLIRRLKEYRIGYLYIADARTEDIVVPDMISDETRIRTMSTLRSSFRTLMEETNQRRSTVGFEKEFRNIMSMIIDDLSSHKEGMIMLMNLSVTDHYLFQHSMNVCVFTSMIGMHNHYGRDELMTLGLGALLHDIGKIKVPPAILNKKDKLTKEEFDIIKKHTEEGYRILKNEPNIPLIAAHCAFQHHERMDGSGYPRGIKGKDIHEYAQWIGLVDSFDAMTTRRVYRNTLLPHEAMEVIYTGSETLYNRDKIEVFRDKIALYPIGLSVKLHTGESGVVADINPICPQRPIIRILEDGGGQAVRSPYEVDLSKDLSAMIVAVNENDVSRQPV